MGCSLKCIFKAGVEESIVNAPVVRLQSKNTNNAKSEVKFKQRTVDCKKIRIHKIFYSLIHPSCCQS
jgi:hypothetical protein